MPEKETNQTTADRRKAWSLGQKSLRQALEGGPDRFTEGLALFFSQHAALHSAQMGATTAWSFADHLFDGLTETQFRRIPKNKEHSIAWCIWHLARIEDVAMNILVAGEAQVLHAGGWLARLQVTDKDTGNEGNMAQVADISAAVDRGALRAYRMAVGRRTRQIVSSLPPADLKSKVDPARLQRVSDEGAVLPAAQGLLDYWGRRTLAGLLLMPPTRHNFVHLNEAERLKNRR